MSKSRRDFLTVTSLGVLGAAASRIQHIGEVLSLAYLPLALWLLSRALDRSSWLLGALAGLAAALIAVNRDQVALLELYLLAAFVITHWFANGRPWARMRASAKPLAAGAAMGAVIALVPMLMTLMLALDSNRPGFDYLSAGRGSLHPAHLLTLAFADLYGAADPAFTYQVTAGSLYGADGFSGALGRAAGETVAGSPYAITQGTLSVGGNYGLTFTAGRTFAITPARLGVPYDICGIQNLMGSVSLAVVKEMLFRAKPISAQRAYEVGIANYVLPASHLEAKTLELVQDMLANSSLVIALLKEETHVLAHAQPLTGEPSPKNQSAPPTTNALFTLIATVWTSELGPASGVLK